MAHRCPRECEWALVGDEKGRMVEMQGAKFGALRRASPLGGGRGIALGVTTDH